MNFLPPFIDKALGSSIFHEEYKGDFAAARRAAEELMNAARRQADPNRFAEALLAHGVVHLLQGEPAAAFKIFQELDASVAETPYRFLAISFAHLADYMRYNFFPGGSGAPAIEIKARWNEFKTMVERGSRWRALLGQFDDEALRLAGQWVYEFFTKTISYRAMLQTASESTPQDVSEVLRMAEEDAESFRQQFARR